MRSGEGLWRYGDYCRLEVLAPGLWMGWAATTKEEQETVGEGVRREEAEKEEKDGLEEGNWKIFMKDNMGLFLES